MRLRNALRVLAKAARLARTPRYRRALRFGVGAAIEHEPVLHELQQDRPLLVVDIGANVGQFSLAVRQCLPQARVLAFEPLAGPARRFRQLFRDDPAVRLIECAIGPGAGRAEMHVSKAVDSSSMLPIGRAQTELFPGTDESHVEPVDVAPLDQFVGPEGLPPRTVIKIDVQGYEFGVLNGCESLLPAVAAIYVECSFVELYEGQALAHEVVDWLGARGFGLSRIGLLSVDRRGLAAQADLLFRAIRRGGPPLRPPVATRPDDAGIGGALARAV